MDVIMNLNNNKAQAPDNIPVRILKETAVQITPSLCALFNKSLRVGVLPNRKNITIMILIKPHCSIYTLNYKSKLFTNINTNNFFLAITIVCNNY